MPSSRSQTGAGLFRGRPAAGALLVVLTALAGCASADEGAVAQVARAFEDPAGDVPDRCDLLAPATRTALERSGSAPCADVLGDLPLRGGEVRSVQVWGGNAQVRMAGDTVFLSETGSGWRVTAAGCRPHGEEPYDCEVEGL